MITRNASKDLYSKFTIVCTNMCMYILYIYRYHCVQKNIINVKINRTCIYDSLSSTVQSLILVLKTTVDGSLGREGFRLVVCCPRGVQDLILPLPLWVLWLALAPSWLVFRFPLCLFRLWIFVPGLDFSFGFGPCLWDSSFQSRSTNQACQIP